MKTYSFPSLLVVVILFFSCSKSSPTDNNELVQIQPIDYDLFPTVRFCPSSSINSSQQKESFIVIKDATAYADEFGCQATMPEVDFNTHFILAGRVAFRQCIETKNQKIELKSGVIRYHVALEQSDCQKIDTAFFAASLPIEYKDKEIDFVIEYLN
ncbi:hypothetical protein [Pedobacter deserti]|uniref:hypothetical protein n=1 Tax=Pedobacter deserti TaxID=2817382 RepID=UPI00210870D5|nr:hypothetical protein [Pedobacter sp. SYSU D00382]